MLRIRSTAHNTHPLVLHCPGPRRRRHRIWREVEQRLFAAPPTDDGCPDDVAIVTWSTRADPENTPLLRSLTRRGVPRERVVVLAAEPWTNWCKIATTVAWLEQLGQGIRIIMGFDADDVLVLAPPERIAAAFNARPKVGLLTFAAERHPYPPTKVLSPVSALERLRAATSGQMPYCHFNAGCFIGARHTTQHYFNTVSRFGPLLSFPQSDQGAWRMFYTNPQNVYARRPIDIDRRQELFAVAAGRYDPPDAVVMDDFTCGMFD